MTLASSSVKYATSKISFRARSCRVVTPALFSIVGRGPSGREPWASVSIMASWAGLGAGNPSGRGNLKGTAETMAAEEMERARIGVERGKCMMEDG